MAQNRSNTALTGEEGSGAQGVMLPETAARVAPCLVGPPIIHDRWMAGSAAAPATAGPARSGRDGCETGRQSALPTTSGRRMARGLLPDMAHAESRSGHRTAESSPGWARWHRGETRDGERHGVAETATLQPRATVTTSRAYLLVIEDGSSRVCPLPSTSMVTIGRAPDVDLQLDHPSVSRRHAQLLTDRGEARISDLDSHNGTRVNNEILHGARVLIAGDVVTVGEVIVVFHAEPY